MSINPIEDNATPKPTGSLEDLFRHHLDEEAAVPPRPMLWDQIDNSLLIRQNETYRRRLLATRWVAAASLLLATLAGTGWWAHRASDMAGPEMATTGTTGSGAGTSAATGAPAGIKGQASAAGQAAGSISANGAIASNNAPATAANAAANGALNRTSAPNKATSPTSAYPISANSASGVSGSIYTPNAPGYATTGQGTAMGTQSGLTPEATGNYGQAAIVARTTPSSSASAQTPSSNGSAVGIGAESTTLGATVAAGIGTAGSPLSGAEAGTAALGAFGQASATALPGQVGMLAASPASLALATPAALPQGLAALPETESLPTPAVQKWHYGGSYTAGVFNPNINFSRAGIEPAYGYNPALGAGSPELTETAAAQYRDNLRPGLSQRIALLATRHLGGHWSLSSGAELSQATAQSASNAAFVGEQILDLGRPSSGPLRTTDFRYRMAGIPVEVRYTNPVKRGWSLYGRLGGAVTALLGVRSEVEGNPEATRTYSLTSAGTPYRRVLANVRAGLGAQFRPTGHNWALSVGPTADASLMSLNAHPAQSFLKESRAYGYGLEVAMEFGK